MILRLRSAGFELLVVDLRLAGLRIDRIAQPYDRAAHAGAAFGDPDTRVAILGEPGAGRLGGIGAGQHAQSETERSGKANDVKDHGGSKCGSSGNSWRHSYPAHPDGQPKVVLKR